ncbi:17303_t:CDS:1, partial [Funneliformis caledonium]
NIYKEKNELLFKRTRKLKNNEKSKDDNLETKDDERDTNEYINKSVELLDLSENKNYNEDDKKDEEIQVVTQSFFAKKAE